MPNPSHFQLESKRLEHSRLIGGKKKQLDRELPKKLSE